MQDLELSKNVQNTAVKSSSLPCFPEFRTFAIDDIEWYQEYYIDNNLNPYVDIHYQNLLVWLNINNDLKVSSLDDTVILQYTNSLNKKQINTLPLNDKLNDSTLNKIFSYLEANHLPVELREVPSHTCSNLNTYNWCIENDRDSFEYILKTEQQSLLEGHDFSRQRRRVNYFEREHENDEIDIEFHTEINNNTIELFNHHISTMQFNSTEKSSKENENEPIAIRKNLEYSSIFGKKALIIKINGKAVSLTMLSYLDKKTAAINHIKVDYEIQYIFQYTIYKLACILKEVGISEMNLEQDLGISGLRSFKERLQPAYLLEKKIIKPYRE